MFGVKRVVALAAAAVVAAQAQGWENLFPSYSGLASDGSKFVAVSEDRLIRTGGGAGEWSQYFVPSGGSLNSAAYGKDRFIVMQGSTNTTFLSSGNGQNWVSRPAGTYLCKYLTFGGSDFVGIGESGRTFLFDLEEEDDGWSPWDSEWSEEFYHVAYGAENFVAVGTYIESAANGKQWRRRHNAAAGVVAFGGEKFVAIAPNGSTVYTSADGVNGWTPQQSPNAPAGMKDMTFGGGRFVAVGGGKAAVSADGVSWTVSTLNESDNFRAVKYGNNMFVALGANGSLYTLANGASSWVRQADGRFMSYKQIVYGGTQFVAVGDSGVSVSGDGRSWVRKDYGKRLQSVAFGGNRFVAVGDSGAIWTSDDGGNTWINYPRDPAIMFTSAAFGDSAFVIGGRTMTGAGGGAAKILTSADGQNWSEQSGDLEVDKWQYVYPAALCYGNGKFVAGGNSTGGTGDGGGLRHTGYAAGSTGKFWTVAEATKSYRIMSVTYANDKFVALGSTTSGNVLLTSVDGVSWTPMPLPAVVRGAKSATYAKGYYLVAADSGNIYGSQDGLDWSPQRKVTNRNLNTVYFGNNVVFAAGAAGAMLYLSGDPISVRHTPASRRAALSAWGMTIDNARKSPVITLSFTPDRPGTIAVYSLTGRQLYKKRVGAGERAISLPGRIASNGSVIVRYSGDGRTVAKRFQMVK
jgi:hypothetical protein